MNNILVIELYEIAYKFIIQIVIKITLIKILEPTILLIFYINSNFLYI